jgi:hypothetical protein
MAPTIDAMEALSTLADQEGNGLLTERGEFVMDEAMAAVVKALAAEIGGLGARSKVVRRLITKGARVELAERQAKAAGPVAVLAVTNPTEAARLVEREKRRERDRRRREKLAQEAAQA